MNATSYFALVDCNSFYASCEELFAPQLKNKPVVVLSNNDGCIIARNKLAKAVGIKMGMPLFQARPILEAHNVSVFSSNYTLYGDMSRRVMQTLSAYAPALEVYSIDEAFLSLEGIAKDKLLDFAIHLRQIVYKHTGIPVGIGIGKTKTLAKIANRFAKKGLSAYSPGLSSEGVFFFDEQNNEAQSLLDSLPCNEIWGVASGLAQRLIELKIHFAKELACADRALIRKHLGVVGERLVLELNGVSCLALEEIVPQRKNMCHSRSFGSLVSELTTLEEIVATFASRLGEKLREQKLAASVINVFLQTDPHRPDLKQYFPSINIGLEVATNYTPTLIKEALKLLKRIYKKDHYYKKAGIMALELVAENTEQLHLWKPVVNKEKEASLMAAFDKINKQFGKQTLRCASSLPSSSDNKEKEASWQMRAEKRSPRYTTRFDELPIVKL